MSLLDFSVIAGAAVIAIALLLAFINYTKFKGEYKFYEPLSHVPAWEAYRSKGTIGEFKCYRQLKTLETYHQMLANLYLPSPNGEMTEIDLLFISTSGIYIIESKNYSGWIFGTVSQKNWTESVKGGKKYKFFNPIWQNEGHKKALKQVLNTINPNVFYSFIVFSPECELKKITMKDPSTTNIYLIKRQHLHMRVSEHMKQHHDVLSANQVNEIYQKLLPYTNASTETKEQHINTVLKKK